MKQNRKLTNKIKPRETKQSSSQWRYREATACSLSYQLQSMLPISTAVYATNCSLSLFQM